MTSCIAVLDDQTISTAVLDEQTISTAVLDEQTNCRAVLDEQTISTVVLDEQSSMTNCTAVLDEWRAAVQISSLIMDQFIFRRLFSAKRKRKTNVGNQYRLKNESGVKGKTNVGNVG